MKEDVLEQLVDDYLQCNGYFTRHNVKFKPFPNHKDFDSQKDSVASDIDVVGVNPRSTGKDKVRVVSCKSWGEGLDIKKWVDTLTKTPDKKISGRESWKFFRELVIPKWTDAMFATIKQIADTEDFTYITAVTYICDEKRKTEWESCATFKQALRGNPIKIMTLKDMLHEVFAQLGSTVESSQFSRTLQLIKAAGMTLELENADQNVQRVAREEIADDSD